MKYIEMHFYNTYYYCNIIINVINSFEFVSKLNEFFEGYFDEDSAENYRFPKYSMLHSFCRWIVDELIWNDMNSVLDELQLKYDECTGDQNDRLDYVFHNEDGSVVRLQLESVIELYLKERISFQEWLTERKFDFFSDAAIAFFDENEDLYFRTLDMVSNEVFYLLFQNRQFLMWFNHTAASWNEMDNIKMKRCYVPEWVKNAIRYRDKGRCVFCGKDVVGTYEVQDDRMQQYDHIVPLDKYGINDISNIQLTCNNCNNTKSVQTITNNVYIDWYEK